VDVLLEVLKTPGSTQRSNAAQTVEYCTESVLCVYECTIWMLLSIVQERGQVGGTQAQPPPTLPLQQRTLCQRTVTAEAMTEFSSRWDQRYMLSACSLRSS